MTGYVGMEDGMRVCYVGKTEIIIGGLMVLPNEVIEVGPHSLETLRHQYGQDAFVVQEGAVVAEPDPVKTEPEPEPVAEDVPTTGKKKK